MNTYHVKWFCRVSSLAVIMMAIGAIIGHIIRNTTLTSWIGDPHVQMAVPTTVCALLNATSILVRSLRHEEDDK